MIFHDVHVYCVFFIHASIGGHSGVRALATVTNAAVNMGVRISFRVSAYTSFFSVTENTDATHQRNQFRQVAQEGKRLEHGSNSQLTVPLP